MVWWKAVSKFERANWREIVRQVERIERNQRLQRIEQRRRDELGRDMVRPAMNDPMTDGAKARVAEMIVDEFQQARQRRGKVRGRVAGFAEHGARRVAGDEMRRRLQVLDFAPSGDGQRGADDVEGEFKARRAGVEHQEGSPGAHGAAPYTVQ
jgi:hypothetical protein